MVQYTLVRIFRVDMVLGSLDYTLYLGKLVNAHGIDLFSIHSRIFKAADNDLLGALYGYLVRT